jgi:polar amino acid transport system substrate-binding protein
LHHGIIVSTTSMGVPVHESTLLPANMTTTPTPAAMHDLAPTGAIRAAINLGNPVLAQRDAATGELRGVSVALAHELGRRVGREVTLVPFDAAGKVFQAIQQGLWDVAFLAVDPARSTEILFTAPYVIIEGTYLVPESSALRKVEDVDREGVRIAVAAGAAYDLFLTRHVKRAQLVRRSTGADALAMFLDEKLEAAAGVRQPLVKFARQHPGLRVMEGRFMAIEQAMGTPRPRNEGVRYLTAFIEQMKASGFVAAALQATGQADATVAPPAAPPVS